jgi:membrane associated rhomboid family serine protease
MPDHGEVVREKRVLPVCWATIGLLITLGVAWLFQMFLYYHNREASLEYYFALSLEGLKKGHVWQLLSFQFMHATPAPWHLLLNCWAIFVFGRAVELTIGKKEMLKLYFFSGIMGGLVEMACIWLFPNLFGDVGVIGASAGAFGLVAAFAVLYPNEKLILLLFFIIPIKLKATTLLWLSIGICVFGIFLPYLAPYLPPKLGIVDLFGNVAHAAHLGGIAAGFGYAVRLVRRFRRRPPPVIPPTLESPMHAEGTAK